MTSDPIARLLGGIEGPVAPRPDYTEALLARLLAELAQDNALAADAATPHQEESMLDTATLLPANPVPIASWQTTAASERTAAPGWRDRALVFLATAALVLLTLVGSFVAFGPHRPGRQEPATAYLAAPIGTFATPIAAQAAPLVEFVWQADGGEAFPLSAPTNAALDPRGNLWVTDGDKDRILIFSPDGQGVLSTNGGVLEAWGSRGDGEGEFNFRCSGFRYGGIAFDAAGNIYVADSGNQRVQKFAPDRSYLMSFGSEGVADGEFLCPGALAVDRQGRIYVSDTQAGRVVVFAPDGAPLATWKEGLSSPGGVTIDSDGNVWVADDARGFVKFSPAGEVLLAWDEDSGPLYAAIGIAIDAQGRAFIADGERAAVRVFADDGEFLGSWGSEGIEPGQLTGPVAVALDGQGHVYVVEYSNHRVQKFRLLPPLAP